MARYLAHRGSYAVPAGSGKGARGKVVWGQRPPEKTGEEVLGDLGEGEDDGRRHPDQ